METTICSVCKNPIVKDSIGTGYGIYNNNKKVCYSCIGHRDLSDLESAAIGDRFTYYFTEEETDVPGAIALFVTNWPGTMKLPCHYRKKSRHNFGTTRSDFWFRTPKNRHLFWGYQIGDNNQIAHIQRIKD